MSDEAGIHRRWTRRLKRRRERKQREATKFTAARKHFNAAKNQVAAALRVLGRHPLPLPLRVRAHDEAVKFIGVVEKGGNNTGPVVDEIIRENGGVVGEPWCGDFQAFVYRRAGSKGVDRSWASVRLVGSDPDVKVIAKPKLGDMVRYTFDHIGMFESDNGNGTITTVEGNTGSSGAVSDSHFGTDGVKRKIRAKTLVRDYLRVLR